MNDPERTQLHQVILELEGRLLAARHALSLDESKGRRIKLALAALEGRISAELVGKR